MIPKEKINAIIAKHDNIEKELSSGNVDSKLYAGKSKEYSDLSSIVKIAREFVNFDHEKKDLELIIEDKTSDKDMLKLAAMLLVFAIL